MTHLDNKNLIANLTPSFTTSPSKYTRTVPRSIYLKALGMSAILFSGILPLTAVHADDNVLEATIIKQSKIVDHQVAFVPFADGDSISKIVLNDLSNSSLKATSQGLVQKVHSSKDLAATLPAWQMLGIPYLVIGSAQGNSVRFEVIEVATGRMLTTRTRQGGSVQTITGRDIKDTAHKTSALIYEMITGKKSDFNAKIAYIEETGFGKNKTSSLFMRDSDGENPRLLTKVHNASIFSPTASPDGRYLVYSVQLEKNNAKLFRLDLGSNSVQQLVNLKGSNLSPSFSPDGRSILFSSTADGDADIYRVSSSGGSVQKIIDLPYDQVQPSYAPDGSFVFVSDHTNPNRPSIYRYSSGTVSRVSRGSYAANPSYSPDGTKIGYLNGGSAAVMSSNGSNLANFGNTGIDEAPRFSPSSERVVYSQGKNRSTIVIRSLTGGNTITKRADGTVRSPVWIPSVD